MEKEHKRKKTGEFHFFLPSLSPSTPVTSHCILTFLSSSRPLLPHHPGSQNLSQTEPGRERASRHGATTTAIGDRC